MIYVPMKRLVAQLQDSKRDDYDPEERGEVTAVGEHHGGSFRTYFAHKVTKLREQHQPNLNGDKNKQIFRGCIMYVNGLTELPIEELRRLISLHGGEHIMYRAVKITHYVCNHFTDAQLKLEHAKVKLNAKNKVHNVSVAWVLDSIKQMRRLDENLYVPKGLKDHGNVLTKSFLTTSNVVGTSLNSGSTSSICSGIESVQQSTSNSAAEVTQSKLIHCGVNLTHSQELFLNSIPVEFREEALAELGKDETSKKVGAMQETLPHDRVTTEVVDLFTPPEKLVVPVVVDDEATIHRRNRLTSMVECIHYNEEGELCTSKAVIYRMKEYIHTLIDATAIDKNTSNMLVYLLTDYAAYLRTQNQYDQVCTSLLSRLNTKTTDYSSFITLLL